jgi:glutamine synthetase
MAIARTFMGRKNCSSACADLLTTFGHINSVLLIHLVSFTLALNMHCWSDNNRSIAAIVVVPALMI